MGFNRSSLSYVPTLAIRPSEMNGLEQLPGTTKDNFTPLFLLAPWANSKGLAKSIARIEKAFPKRPYFLDLDRDYFLPQSERSQSQEELFDLFCEDDNYKNWVDFISNYDSVFPCLQHVNQSRGALVRQINAIQRLNKTFCVRIELRRDFTNIPEIIAALNQEGTADYVVVIEGGWVPETTVLEAQIQGILTNLFQGVDATVPIIISYTTIPKVFSDIEGCKEFYFDNRRLITSLSKNSNRRFNLVYGDWASTRPREYSMGRRPLPRIDYPTKKSWIIARNKTKNWGFDAAAKEIISNPEWTPSLGIWGEQMIELTSENPSFGIDTPQKNVAARVNIHLHRQAFYDEDDISGLDLDEDWED